MHQSDVHFIGSWLVWDDGKVLHIGDVRSGGDATAALEASVTGVVEGMSSIALFDANGVSAIDLASARPIHRAEGIVDGNWNDGVYVFAGTTVERFDETAKRLAWRTPIDVPVKSVEITDVITVRGGDRATILDRDTGKLLASGEIAKDIDKLGVDLGRRGNHVFGRGGQGDHLKLVAHDVLGTPRWSVPWPEGFSSPQLRESDDGTRLVMAERSTVALFDGVTGKELRRFQGNFVRFGDGCVVVVDDRSLSCQAPDGAMRWSTPLGGGEHRTWVVGSDVLLVDSIPLHVSRVSRDGKVAWTLELADAKLDDKGIAQDGQHWILHRELATIVSETSAQVIDLDTGKRTELWHAR